MTLGEQRIGNFNPSDNPVVAEIKRKAAELIDFINDNISETYFEEDLSHSGVGEEFTHPEVFRLKSLAFTTIEQAAMWAVKAHFTK